MPSLTFSDALADLDGPPRIHLWYWPQLPSKEISNTVRQVLADCLQRPRHQLQFARGEFGKPYLPDSELKFNWSDSNGAVLLAVAKGIELGVDVEVDRQLKQPERMAKRILSASEWLRWKALPSELQHDALIRCWVGKEAACKAIGRGIAFGMSRIEISAEKNAFIAIDSVASGFRGVELELPFEAMAYLAYQHHHAVSVVLHDPRLP